MKGEGKKTAAFLWDESFLWGLMAYKALRKANLPFDLLRSQDIRAGRLGEYRVLFVPGGWASNKVKALGDGGAQAIREFVRQGGTYLGFCGGAGLATLDGIGVVPVKRKPTKERVPSFSGRIKLTLFPHGLWNGISDPVFHAWWPSQFVADGDVTVLAAYERAMPDAFSSDVNVGDAETAGRWGELERGYRINLDPKRLQGEPAVIEAPYGKGRVLLSLLHFDTPGDVNGEIVLSNLWKYLADDAGCGIQSPQPPFVKGGREGICRSQNEQTPDAELVLSLEATVAGLTALGERNFLWFWRNPLLLQWRRGVRGLEYCTLFIMVKEIAAILERRKAGDVAQLGRIEELLIPFAEKAQRLLLLERFALQKGLITYERCDDLHVQALREELFSRSKSHGGQFKKLIDEIDHYLFNLLESEGEEA